MKCPHCHSRKIKIEYIGTIGYALCCKMCWMQGPVTGTEEEAVRAVASMGRRDDVLEEAANLCKPLMTSSVIAEAIRARKGKP